MITTSKGRCPIQATFALENTTTIDATDEEITVLKAYSSGDSNFVGSFTQEEIMKELELL